MTVMILGGATTSMQPHMLRHLQGRGQHVEFLDSREFPPGCNSRSTPKNGTGSIRLPSGCKFETRADPIHLLEMLSWCLRIDLSDPEQAYIAANDARGLLESLLIRLPARWVNRWSAFQLHRTKPVQLAMVTRGRRARAGDAAGQRPRGGARLQPASSPLYLQAGARGPRQALTNAHLEERNLANLAYAPVTLQEEIPGTNIRVFVAGDRVLGTGNPLGRARFSAMTRSRNSSPHSVPSAVETMCLRMRGPWTCSGLGLTSA